MNVALAIVCLFCIHYVDSGNSDLTNVGDDRTESDMVSLEDLLGADAVSSGRAHRAQRPVSTLFANKKTKERRRKTGANDHGAVGKPGMRTGPAGRKGLDHKSLEHLLPNLEQLGVQPQLIEASGTVEPIRSYCLPVCSPEFNLDCQCLAAEEIIDCTDVNLDGADICLNPKAKRFMHQISELRLSQNDITAIRKHGILIGENHLYLTNLDLSKNSIGYVEPGAFETFQNLAELDLKFNHLTVLHRETLRGLYSLKVLDIRNNNIHSLKPHAFLHQGRLTQLFLDFNPLKTVDERAFNGLVSLQYFSLDYTGISTLRQEWFQDMRRLHTLSLQGNRITTVPSFGLLRGLRTLILTNNPVPEIPKNAFSRFSSLKELHLNNMPQLTTINRCGFCGMGHIEHLNMNNNRNLSFFNTGAFDESGKIGLSHLDIRNSNLRKLSAELLEWSNVTAVYFGGNRWHCDCSLRWMLDVKNDIGPVVARCGTPERLWGKKVRDLDPNDMVCSYEMGPTGRIFAALLITVLLTGASVLIWCLCYSGKGSRQPTSVQNSRPVMPKYAYRNLAMNSEPDEVRLVSEKDIKDKDEDELFRPGVFPQGSSSPVQFGSIEEGDP